MGRKSQKIAWNRGEKWKKQKQITESEKKKSKKENKKNDKKKEVMIWKLKTNKMLNEICETSTHQREVKEKIWGKIWHN